MTISRIVKMAVSGVRHLVERAYRESGELQYLRELVVNCIEGGATRIELGPEWHAVEHEGVYRLMVADNGRGMGPDELLKFLNTFGGGGKPIGDAHENFGVGAKTALLPWNHAGVVVMSWTSAMPEGAMILLGRDPATGEYGAVPFETGGGTYEEVVKPFGAWAAAKPAWIADHGTVVISLGMTGKEDTFLGKSGDGDHKAIAAYLNKRLWDIPAAVEIYVQELRSKKRADWPRTLAEATGPHSKNGGVDRRWNRRQIRGAHFYVAGGENPTTGKVAHQGELTVADGTVIEWYLWEGERPAIHSYAHMNGYIAALYKNELYDTQTHVAHFRSFGITQKTVRDNLAIIARPPLADGSYGVYPDTARNALRIQGTKRAGEPLPWAEWAQAFAENMPEPIQHALAKAGPANCGTLRDPSWRTRLSDRFAARWKTFRWLHDPNGTDRIVADGVSSLGTIFPDADRGDGGDGGARDRKPAATGNQPGGATDAKPTSADKPTPAGPLPASPVEARGGLPEYEWTELANIDESCSYAAAWTRPSKEKPNGVIQIARDFPAVVEVKKYWRGHYPDHLGAEIDVIVEDVYGEAMVARIAHSEQLARDPRWSRSRIETHLRSMDALTMALLGLYGEDHVIRARLAALGPKRKRVEEP